MMFLSNVHTCSRRRSETPHQTRSPISLTWWWTNRSCRWWFEEESRRYLSRLLLLTDVRDWLASLHSDFTQLMPHNLVHFLLHPHWNGFLGISLFMFASFYMSFACIVEMFLYLWILIDHFNLFGKQQLSLPIQEKVWKSRIHAFKFMSLLFNSSQGPSLKSLYRIDRARGYNLFQHIYLFIHV